MSAAILQPAPAATKEPPQLRAKRRILKTLQLLRSGAQDPVEAEVYLREEQKWTAKVEKVEVAT